MSQKKQSSMTSLISAFARAYHMEHDEPIVFHDFVARKLITSEEFTAIGENMTRGIHFFNPNADHQFSGDPNQMLKWITQVQLSPITLARSAYSEQVMLQEAALGVKQMIVLGAGMDTFAFRHPEMEDELDIFEVDLPSEQKLKKERLRQAELVIPHNLHFVPMDFTREMIHRASWSSLFRNVKTMFTLLGVSYYLSKEDLCRLIHHAFAPLPAGSSIVFDYADEHLFQEKGRYNRVANMVKMAAMGGEPMLSCFTYKEMEHLLEKAGLLIYEHLSPVEVQERYFSQRTDDLSAFETIHFIHAVKK
ncbi:methyltransferase (TIGR00027 family) [Paenibacillus sp. 4624]|uniref:S-adenosyl-L-methionine-dependent methyltransferase n=1 Tax=Paenibacillus amylolyticus TaxID=1451 RepID=A0A5M9WVG6_PAEAM|nr:SAM-dependent methyltransferase [Paenibacillus amylolyticus]KAA8785459.1 class I SAM-dependent methyltransferase [Paenibacillus amylolyticus]